MYRDNGRKNWNRVMNDMMNIPGLVIIVMYSTEQEICSQHLPLTNIYILSNAQCDFLF